MPCDPHIEICRSCGRNHEGPGVLCVDCSVEEIMKETRKGHIGPSVCCCGKSPCDCATDAGLFAGCSGNIFFGADMALPADTQIVKSGEPVKLHLGCYNKAIPGFVNVDVRPDTAADVVDDCALLEQFQVQSADLIYACHILEHFDWDEVPRVLSRWQEVLKFGGTLRVAVPDLMAAAEHLVYHKTFEPVRTMLLGSQKHPFDFHNAAFTEETLTKLLQEAGFSDVRRYNWWDTEHAHIDDYSQSYYPSKNVTYKGGKVVSENGNRLMSLNLEATKR